VGGKGCNRWVVQTNRQEKWIDNRIDGDRLPSVLLSLPLSPFVSHRKNVDRDKSMLSEANMIFSFNILRL